MAWQCKFIEVLGARLVQWEPPPGGGKCGETRLLDAAGNEHRFDDLPVGTMFSVPESPERGWPWFLTTDDWLSDHYRQHNAGRRPLLVVLPGRHLFCVDGQCWSDGKRYGGWQVTGQAPNITVSPSINLGGLYHGWLRNGVISDDCEGRKFDEMGRSIR